MLSRENKGKSLLVFFATNATNYTNFYKELSHHKGHEEREDKKLWIRKRLNYLKTTGKPVGLLVNFKHSKAMIKRMALNLPEGHDIQ